MLLASRVLLASCVMPPGCGSASGSDEAARLGRAAGGAALLWDHRAVFNATKECYRSQGPSLGAGSGWALVLLQLLSPKVSSERKRPCPVSPKPSLSQHPNFPLFGCMALPKQSWLCLSGQPHRGWG